ncbi:MAG TPA: phage antirepressor KilAC domain-containing protein [Sphingomicrobium sp.]|nr:phage antirepressor KilAC domain-containing protein [Sphingomicrobium sp.]
MNEITTFAEATMSSREIAALTGSTHDNVLKTVRSLVERGVIFGNETPYRHPQNGQMYSEFLLSFRDTMVVVSGYSAELRARIIDRWQDLEKGAAAAFQIPRTMSEALRLAANQAEQIETQQKLIEKQAPAVEFAHAVKNTNDAISIGDMGRLLGIGQNTLFKKLRADHVLMEGNRPYQHYIERGYFRLVESVWIDDAREPHITFKTLVTGRGQVYLTAKYGATAEQPA